LEDLLLDARTYRRKKEGRKVSNELVWV
jgi:hypothetical protein